MSKNFSMSDFIRSKTADDRKIDNSPSIDIQRQLVFTMAGMERVKAFLKGFPIQVLSGYRCIALNSAVGGAENSQHIKGEACDFVCPAFGIPFTVCIALARNVKILGIDQLIFESGWVHCSFTFDPRYEILTRTKVGYVQGIEQVTS